jgi:hypothetical protein
MKINKFILFIKKIKNEKIKIIKDYLIYYYYYSISI